MKGFDIRPLRSAAPGEALAEGGKSKPIKSHGIERFFFRPIQNFHHPSLVWWQIRSVKHSERHKNNTQQSMVLHSFAIAFLTPIA